MDRIARSNGFRMGTILYATDFMESSRLALDYAVALAHRFSAPLTIMHAFEPSSEALEAEYIAHRPSVSRVEALVRLENMVSGVRRVGLDVTPELREGYPFHAIIEAANDCRCDLLVLGTHGLYRGIQHLLIGSNAEKVLLSAPCPTLTIGRHVLAGIDLEVDFREILLICDPTPENAPAARYAFQMAREFESPVRFFVQGSDGQTPDQRINEFLEHLFEDSPLPQTPRCELGSVSNAQEMIRWAERSANSLVVTAAHRIGRLDRHLHSSFPFELAARSAAPMISIPSGSPSGSMLGGCALPP